ncbi:Rap guanine nucleotide exchange factor, putative (EPAC) [Balamuthia mandrillaris]
MMEEEELQPAAAEEEEETSPLLLLPTSATTTTTTTTTTTEPPLQQQADEEEEEIRVLSSPPQEEQHEVLAAEEEEEEEAEEEEETEEEEEEDTLPRINCFGHCSVTRVLKTGYISRRALERLKDGTTPYHYLSSSASGSPPASASAAAAGGRAEAEQQQQEQQGMIAAAKEPTSLLARALLLNYALNWGLKQFCPRWLSANVFYIAGLCCALLAATLALVFGNSAAADGLHLRMHAANNTTEPHQLPWWLYFLAGTLLLLQSTLNLAAVKQALRTSATSVSPLTEIVEHECNLLSLIAWTFFMKEALVLGILCTYFTYCSFMLAYFLANSKSYVWSRRKPIGRWGIGVTECQLLFVGLMYLSGFFACFFDIEIWRYRLSNNRTLPLGYVFAYSLCILALFAVLESLLSMGPKLSRRKRLVASSLMQLTPMVAVMVLGMTWALIAIKLLESFPHLFLLTQGFLLSYIMLRLVVQRLVRGSIRVFFVILTPLTVCVLNSLLVRIYSREIQTNEVTFLSISTIMSGTFFFLLCFCLLRQLSKSFQQRILTVPTSSATHVLSSSSTSSDTATEPLLAADQRRMEEGRGGRRRRRRRGRGAGGRTERDTEGRGGAADEEETESFAMEPLPSSSALGADVVEHEVDKDKDDEREKQEEEEREQEEQEQEEEEANNEANEEELVTESSCPGEEEEKEKEKEKGKEKGKEKEKRERQRGQKNMYIKK